MGRRMNGSWNAPQLKKKTKSGKEMKTVIERSTTTFIETSFQFLKSALTYYYLLHFTGDCEKGEKQSPFCKLYCGIIASFYHFI